MIDAIIRYIIRIEEKNVLDKDELKAAFFTGLFVPVLGLLGGAMDGLSKSLLGLMVVGLMMMGVAGGCCGLIAALFSVIGSLTLASIFIAMSYFPVNFLIPILITTFILGEIIFCLFDKAKPNKNQNRFSFTCKRKAFAFLTSAFILLEINGIYQLSIRGYPIIKRHFPEIVKWLGYIGLGIIGLAIIAIIFYGYIKLNSLKYNGDKG